MDDTYNVDTHGVVTAIRIYTDWCNAATPMAELAFAFGGSTLIPWNDPSQRELYKPGITGYTLVFDERLPAGKTFEDFIHPQGERATSERFEVGDKVVLTRYRSRFSSCCQHHIPHGSIGVVTHVDGGRLRVEWLDVDVACEVHLKEISHLVEKD